MNNKGLLSENLSALNLNSDEARVFIELIEKPNTHLGLSRSTGINRSKVYRIVDALIRRSLVTRRVDDRGMLLVANDPEALAIELVAQEAEVKRRREVYDQLLPELHALSGRSAMDRFAVQTYEGVEGFKQMQWHELSTVGELLVFGNMSVEQLGINHGWAEKFRMHTVERGYALREIFNTTHGVTDFTSNHDFMEMYDARIVAADILPMETPMVIYNDTVAIYQFDDERRVGAEVINAAYAATMRRIFEHYWRLGKPLADKNTS